MRFELLGRVHKELSITGHAFYETISLFLNWSIERFRLFVSIGRLPRCSSALTMLRPRSANKSLRRSLIDSCTRVTPIQWSA